LSFSIPSTHDGRTGSTKRARAMAINQMHRAREPWSITKSGVCASPSVVSWIVTSLEFAKPWVTREVMLVTAASD